MNDQGNNPQNTKTAAYLVEKLNDEQTIDVLARLLDKIDTLENTVNKLSDAIESAPTMLSMTVDTIDDSISRAEDNGVNVEARLKGALQLVEKLSSEEMLDKLNKAIYATEQLPGMMSMMADMADERIRAISQRGIDVEERFGAALGLLEKMTSPTMTGQMNTMLKLSEQMPGMMSMLIDFMDEAYQRAEENGEDSQEKLDHVVSLVTKLSSTKFLKRLDIMMGALDQSDAMITGMIDMLEFLRRKAWEKGIDLEALVWQGMDTIRILLQSGVFDSNAIEVIADLAGALKNTKISDTKPKGMFGAMKALKDPDMKRAIGYFLAVGKQLGNNLEDNN